MKKIKYAELQRELKRLMELKELNPHNDNIEINIYCNDKFIEAKIHWFGVGYVNEEEANIFANNLKRYISLTQLINDKYSDYEIEY